MWDKLCAACDADGSGTLNPAELRSALCGSLSSLRDDVVNAVATASHDSVLVQEVVLPPRQPLFLLEQAERNNRSCKIMRVPSRPKRLSRSGTKYQFRTNVRLPVIWEGPEQEALCI
jgi:hypothetical protein